MTQQMSELRVRVARLERSRCVADRVGSDRATDASHLPFDIAGVDRTLPAGGLLYGALHEASGTGSETEHAAGATSFLAGIAARAMASRRLWGIWIAADPPFMPALMEYGIDPDRMLFARTRSRASILQAMEDALRCRAMAVVIGEPGAELTHTASRRLQLAAEVSGTLGLILRRSRIFDDPRLSNPSAATTRWRVGAAPSGAPYSRRPDLRGLGPVRWKVDLVKNRGGDTGSWLVEASDAQGRLRLASDAPDRSVAPNRFDPAPQWAAFEPAERRAA